MSYNKDSTLTPNSGFRTIQIKRTPGNEFPMQSYSLLRRALWQFLSHLKPTRQQTAPAQIHGTAERLGCTTPAASPEPPPGTRVLRSEPAGIGAAGNTGHPRTHSTTPAHPATGYSGTWWKPCEELHKSSGGQNPWEDGAKGHSSVLLLSVKIYVFQQTCKALLSQKFKVCGDKSSVQQCCTCLLRLFTLGGPTQHFFWVEQSLTHCRNAASKHAKLTFISTLSNTFYQPCHNWWLLHLRD